MDQVKIPTSRLVSYLSAFNNAFGYANFMVGLSQVSRSHPNENLVFTFRQIILAKTTEIEAIPLTYLAEFTEAWCLGFRSEEKPHMILASTRRVGRSWWGAESPFHLDLYERTCLYTELKPLISEDFKNTIKRVYGIEAFQKALNVLVNYLNENYYCQISIENLEEKRFAFNIQYHPFARMDDQDFRVFWGLLDMFCEWLSLPIKTQIKDKAKLIEIDEEASTANYIVIIYPYNR